MSTDASQNPATIFLSADDAELFKLFREHQQTFKDMMASGVFTTKNGQALLSFSHDGTLMTIEVSQTIFRRKKGNT